MDQRAAAGIDGLYQNLPRAPRHNIMSKNGNNSTKRNLWNRPMTRSTAGVQQSEKELSITRDTSIEKAVLTRKMQKHSNMA